MTLNGDQFKKYTPWVATADTDEVREEHDFQHRNLIDFDAKNDPFRRGYPAYEGHGSSLLAHDGIISRGYEGDLNEAHEELVKRGEPVAPLNIDRDVATVALGQQRKVVAGAREKIAAGPPPQAEVRRDLKGRPMMTPLWGRTPLQSYNHTVENLPHVERHEEALERHLSNLHLTGRSGVKR